MRRTLLVLMVMTIAAGCRRNPEDDPVSEPAPPPAAALAGRGQSLDASLRQLEQELSQALGKGVPGDGERHLLTAEAITDRLLEAQMPFTWLTGTAYSLESYVRQIQALADRVVAEMRSGVDQVLVVHDATDLRRKVIGLRQAMAKGGGNPPPSLDSLLAAHPSDSTVIEDAGE